MSVPHPALFAARAATLTYNGGRLIRNFRMPASGLETRGLVVLLRGFGPQEIALEYSDAA